jgi:hypothetical protein
VHDGLLTISLTLTSSPSTAGPASTAAGGCASSGSVTTRLRSRSSMPEAPRAGLRPISLPVAISGWAASTSARSAWSSRLLSYVHSAWSGAASWSLRSLAAPWPRIVGA